MKILGFNSDLGPGLQIQIAVSWTMDWVRSRSPFQNLGLSTMTLI